MGRIRKRKLFKQVVELKYIGQFLIKSYNCDIKVLQQQSLKTVLTKFLKKFNLTVFEYINNYIQPLKKCNFCNKEYAFYDYKIIITDNNMIKITDIQLHKNLLMCKDLICRHNRAHINPNSFEHYQKCYRSIFRRSKTITKRK